MLGNDGPPTPPAERMADRRVLVTGASGLFGLPVALELAADNDVTAVARFTDTAARDELAAAGARTVPFELADTDLSALPTDVDYVIHAGAMTGRTPDGEWPGPGKSAHLQHHPGAAMECNAQATARLMYHFRRCRAFLYCSSASVYAYQGQRPLREGDPYGLHNTLEAYAASKIAGESLVGFLSRQFDVPAVILRIFSLYGPRGGAPSAQIELMRRGLPIPVYPGGPNRFNLMYETDYVTKAIAALGLADVPAFTVNFGGSQTMSVEDYCRFAAGLLGLEARFHVTSQMYWPLWADLSTMESRLGPTTVSVTEGIRRVIAAQRGPG